MWFRYDPMAEDYGCGEDNNKTRRADNEVLRRLANHAKKTWRLSREGDVATTVSDC